MRAAVKRWIPWVVSVALLCASVGVATVLISPRWEAHWATEIADGDTRFALTWSGETISVDQQAGLTGQAGAQVASVQPAAGWVVRPGLQLTSPDHSVRITVQVVSADEAAARWEQALDEGFVVEQRETLRTGAELRSVTLDEQLVGVMTFLCRPAGEASQTEQVAVVTATELGSSRVALGQLLETVCEQPTEAEPAG